MPNETDREVVLALEALERCAWDACLPRKNLENPEYAFQDWTVGQNRKFADYARNILPQIAQAVLDKDARLRQIAHTQVAYAPPWCVELLKEIQESRNMWQSGHMELRVELEKRDARIKELEEVLVRASRTSDYRISADG